MDRGKQRVGLLGAAFDPPTLGHWDVVQQVAPHHDTLLLVPSACHAFAKPMQPFTDRIAMLRRLIADGVMTSSCRVVACDLELQLFAQQPHKPVYTYDVLVAIEKAYGSRAIVSFIRGPDNAKSAVWNRFYRAQEIQRRWRIFTAQERLPVRSRLARAVLTRQSLDQQVGYDISQLLSPGVQRYIQHHRLYQLRDEA